MITTHPPRGPPPPRRPPPPRARTRPAGDPVPPILLAAEGEQLFAEASARPPRRRARRAGGRARRRGPSPCPRTPWPSSEGRDESAVELEQAAPGRTVVRWSDRGIPQSREYAVPEVESPGESPAPPGPGPAPASASWTPWPRPARSPRRGALPDATDCPALRGGAGSVAATDGRHLPDPLRPGLPAGAGDVLVGRSPIFACPGLPRDTPANRPGRRPRRDPHRALDGVDRGQAGPALPRRRRHRARARAGRHPAALEPADAASLAASLGLLPGGGQPHAAGDR